MKMFSLSHPRRMTMADVNAVENSFILTAGETNGRFIGLGIEGRGGYPVLFQRNAMRIIKHTTWHTQCSKTGAILCP